MVTGDENEPHKLDNTVCQKDCKDLDGKLIAGCTFIAPRDAKVELRHQIKCQCVGGAHVTGFALSIIAAAYIMFETSM